MDNESQDNHKRSTVAVNAEVEVCVAFEQVPFANRRKTGIAQEQVAVPFTVVLKHRVVKLHLSPLNCKQAPMPSSTIPNQSHPTGPPVRHGNRHGIEDQRNGCHCDGGLGRFGVHGAAFFAPLLVGVGLPAFEQLLVK